MPYQQVKTSNQYLKWRRVTIIGRAETTGGGVANIKTHRDYSRVAVLRSVVRNLETARTDGNVGVEIELAIAQAPKVCSYLLRGMCKRVLGMREARRF